MKSLLVRGSYSASLTIPSFDYNVNVSLKAAINAVHLS